MDNPSTDNSTTNAVLSATRSVLIAIGAVLSAAGILDSATVQTIVGALMVIIPAVWGIMDKFAAERAAKDRETTAVNAGIKESNAAVPKPMPTVTKIVAQEIIVKQTPNLPKEKS